MKFTLSIVLLGLMAASTSVSADNSRDLAFLWQQVENRADFLAAGISKTLATLERANQGHLNGILLHQAKLIENIKLEMRLVPLNHTELMAPEYFQVWDEMILQLQNEVLQQESATYAVSQNYKTQNLTQDKLGQWAQSLAKQSTEALAKLPHSPEAASLDFEAKTLDQLAKELKVGEKSEQQLALHERTLAKLISKANFRVAHPFRA